MIKKKEEKIREIYRTLEKNTVLKEQKKQNWLDKALNYEEKLEQREMNEYI